MHAPPVTRILIMGCSRSGTTLLQSMLANHSRVHTFPETGVYLKAFGMRGAVLPWVHLGLTAGRERQALKRLSATQSGAPDRFPELPPRRYALSRSLADIASFLDGLARARGKDTWVEKTPRHVFHARRIRRALPGALCIHMVRDGRDVVASIVDRGKKYPEHFPRQSDPRYGIRQWNRSLRATVEAMKEPGHALVFYEKLVGDVEGTLRTLCGIAGLEFELRMLASADLTSFTRPDEEWKSQVRAPVEIASSKFGQLFDQATRTSITRRLELGIFEELRKDASEAREGVLVSGPVRGQVSGNR